MFRHSTGKRESLCVRWDTTPLVLNTNDFAQGLPVPLTLHLDDLSASVELTHQSVDSGFSGKSHEPVVINLKLILSQFAYAF